MNPLLKKVIYFLLLFSGFAILFEFPEENMWILQLISCVAWFYFLAKSFNYYKDSDN